MVKSKRSRKSGKADSEVEFVGGGENRVLGARIPVQILVDYKKDGTYLFDFCKDVSVGGVFIETNAPHDVGAELELTFTIPDSKETLATNGRVIWVQEQASASKSKQQQSAGMGIQFVDFCGEHKAVLAEFVNRYTIK